MINASCLAFGEEGEGEMHNARYIGLAFVGGEGGGRDASASCEKHKSDIMFQKST